jgi:sulfotransferase family protein
VTAQRVPDRRGGSASGPAGGGRPGFGAPVIVLTYPHAGAELLGQLLSESRTLACTFASGLVPLCHDAVTTWQRAEGTGGPPSSLAIQSVRALATTMITVIRAGAGVSRWCEIAFASPAAAQTFLQVFPGSMVICLHRSLPGVFREAASTYPWGLGESPFWAFASGHPGNNVATIAAYWVTRTEALLNFETAHPDSSLRIRYEDLVAEPGQQAHTIMTALGLEASDPTVVPQPEAGPAADLTSACSGQPLPADRIPPQILAKVEFLHHALAYNSWYR